MTAIKATPRWGFKHAAAAAPIETWAQFDHAETVGDTWSRRFEATPPKESRSSKSRVSRIEQKFAWLSVRVGVRLTDSTANANNIVFFEWGKYHGKFCFLIVTGGSRDALPLLGASRELRTAALANGWIENLVERIGPCLNSLRADRVVAIDRLAKLEAAIEEAFK